MRVLAVSDLHGQYNLWRQIIESLEDNDMLFILGDCGDRGPDGWKIIKEALADPRVTYIRGNHDQMLIDCWRSGWSDVHLWFHNGGYETYNAIIDDPDYERYVERLAMTRTSVSYHNTNGQTVYLSHAGFTLMENNEMPNYEDLIWDRDHIRDNCDWWPEQEPNTYVVHGHTPVGSSTFIREYKLSPPGYYVPNEEQTIMRYAHGHKICIDAGCFFNHRISMLNLDTLEEERIFVDNVKK